MTLPVIAVPSSDVDYLSQHKIATSLHGRILMERAIVRCTAEALIAAGYTLRMNDGEGWSTSKNATVEQVMDACMATDEETLHVYSEVGEAEGAKLRSHEGWVFFVYGNDGWDVIADYTTNLEDTLKPASELGDSLQDGAVFTVTTEREQKLEAVLREALEQWNTQFEGEQDNDAWCVQARELLGAEPTPCVRITSVTSGGVTVPVPDTELNRSALDAARQFGAGIGDKLEG